MSAVIGVDLGSTSARAVAIDPEGGVLGSAIGAYPGAGAWPEGRAEAAGWLAGVTEAVARLMAGVPVARRPRALSIGGQSPTTVPSEGGLAVTCRHPAGATGSPAEQHYAQRDVLGEGAVPRQVYDWMTARLGGADVQSRWPGDPTLDGYGPRAGTGTVVGATDGSYGLPEGVRIVAGAQDAYLAFWAGGVDTPGRGLDPGGRTGGLAVAVAAGPDSSGPYALRSPAAGVDIVGGPVSGHGLMLEWLQTFTGLTVPELLALAAKAPPGAGGVLVLPYLEGERAPRWNRGLRAEVVGLGSDTGRAEVARAVLEAAAYGLRHIADSLPVQLRVLVCAGSPALSPLWCSIKASVLEVPVEVPVETDLAAYGAALAAGAGAGWWPGPGEGWGGSWPRPPVTVVEPLPDPAYAAAHRRFIELGDAAERRLAPRAPRSSSGATKASTTGS
jgi:xylulokinase